MDKIKVILNKEEYKTVKICGQKINVNPTINTFGKMALLDICMKQFVSDNKSLPIIKAVFDISVLGMQTNLDISEFTTTNENGNFGISLELNLDCIKYYDESGIIFLVSKVINNYNETWDMIINAVEIENTKTAFSKVLENLPNEKEMNNSLATISKFLKENPEFAKGLVKEQMLNRAKEVYKEERLDSKNEKKAEILSQKVIEKVIEDKKMEIKAKNKTK